MMVLKGVESTWKKIMEKTTRIEKESGFGVKTLGGRSRKQVCFVWPIFITGIYFPNKKLRSHKVE